MTPRFFADETPSSADVPINDGQRSALGHPGSQPSATPGGCSYWMSDSPASVAGPRGQELGLRTKFTRCCASMMVTSLSTGT